MSDTKASAAEAEFCYLEQNACGPSKWGKINANCDGKNQSPVNLNPRRAVDACKKSPLRILKLHAVPPSIKIENNGHSAKLSFNELEVRFFGGPLKAPYILDNIHFHWGATDCVGSEHSIDRQKYSAEAHFVLYNSSFGSLAEAMTQPKGLAVFAILYQLDNSQSSHNPFAGLFSRVTEAHSSYNEMEKTFSLRSLFKHLKFKILSYEGSLTTPDCHETVTWMVSTIPFPISSAELAEFRQLKDSHGHLLLTNVRPLQNLNYRKIVKF